MGLRYLTNIVTLKYDAGKCGGCGLCTQVCPHGVFAIEGGKAKIVDNDACMECGACQKNCAFNAISVESGVGCAAAIIGAMTGKKSVCCGSDEQSKGCCS